MDTESKKGTYILTVNAGSSSIKFGLFTAQNLEGETHKAAVQNIGLPSATLATPRGKEPVAALTHADAARLLVKWLGAQTGIGRIAAVGHRIVHGGPHYHNAQTVADGTLAGLQKMAAFDPEHLPVQLELVRMLQSSLPHAQHVLCFDTAFHHGLPTPARLLAIPRRLEAKGLRRYGFHGLSYAYILQELRRVEGEAAANGKVVIAHLGSGASLAALKGGKPVDTTMGLTPVSGIAMSTRSGDLDPGLVLYLAQAEGYDAERFNHMVNFESGLLGVSGITADMEQLLNIEGDKPHAKDAVDLFCYQAKKAIGGFAAALGGLNTLVFTGGMGENAPKIRARICEGLEFLGVTINEARNQQNARLISADGSQAGVHVIPTNEAVTIARETAAVINNTK